MALTITTPIQLRFTDIDPIGHVNNCVQQTFFDLGKLEFLHTTLGTNNDRDPIRFVIVNISSNFAHQIKFGEHICVRTSITKVGNKSLHFHQSIENVEGTTEYSNCDTVMVALDIARQCSTTIPDSWRESLQYSISGVK